MLASSYLLCMLSIEAWVESGGWAAASLYIALGSVAFTLIEIHHLSLRSTVLSEIFAIYGILVAIR